MGKITFAMLSASRRTSGVFFQASVASPVRRERDRSVRMPVRRFVRMRKVATAAELLSSHTSVNDALTVPHAAVSEAYTETKGEYSRERPRET